MESYDQGLGRFKAYRDAVQGDISVAALPSVAARLLPQVLASLISDHPDVNLRVLDGDHAEVLEYLRSGEADIALAEEPQEGEPGLGVRVLYEDPLLALFPRGHELAALEELEWGDIVRYPFVRLAPSSSVARSTEAGFAASGFTPSRVIDTRTVTVAAGMVAAGIGVTTTTASVMPLMDLNRVETRVLRNPHISRRLAARYRTSPALSPTAGVLLETICASASVSAS